MTMMGLNHAQRVRLACSAASLAFGVLPAMARAQDAPPPAAPPPTEDTPIPTNADPAPPPGPAATPPTPVAVDPGPGERARHEDDDHDRRNPHYLFIQAEGGFSWVNLTALGSGGSGPLPTLHSTTGTGYGGGVTIGLRNWLFAVAAHGYISRFGNDMMGSGSTSGFDIGQVMLEGQLRIPLPLIEPYLRVGVGYAWLGNFQLNSMYAQSTSSIDGWNMKIGAGADIWFGRFFTLGAGLDLAVLNLRRAGSSGSGACPATDPTCIDLSHDGDALGLMLHAHLQAGIHF